MFDAAPSPAGQPQSRAPGSTERRVATEEVLRATAYHEAGHAVAHLRAAEVIECAMPFERVVIRRDWTEPHVDGRGRSIDCAGLVEGSGIYSPISGPVTWRDVPFLRPELQRRMEWDIVTSLAGPFAEAVHLGAPRSRAKLWWCAAMASNGSARHDYDRAEEVLQHYRSAMRRQYGLRRFEDRARDLVLRDWRAIDALAIALLEREQLDFDQACLIVQPILSASS